MDDEPAKVSGQQPVLAYKYKLPGLAFASYSSGTTALSLHKKVRKLSGKKQSKHRRDQDATFFVEACNLKTFACHNPCVCTVKHSAAWPAKSFWMKVVSWASLDGKLLSSWFGQETKAGFIFHHLPGKMKGFMT